MLNYSPQSFPASPALVTGQFLAKNSRQQPTRRRRRARPTKAA